MIANSKYVVASDQNYEICALCLQSTSGTVATGSGQMTLRMMEDLCKTQEEAGARVKIAESSTGLGAT